MTDPQLLEVGRYLNPLGWPQGLQRTLLRTCETSPLRFFILDDSGSMCCNDGHKIVGHGAAQKVIQATRWSELGDSVRFHAGMAHAAGSPCEFRFLNASEPLVIGNRDFTGQSEANLATVLRILEGGPNGGTPLCQHIQEVGSAIIAAAPQLRENNHRAVIVIITDGEATDGSMIKAMRPLKDLPVHIVLRVCTDEDKVVSYWNDIDAELELGMDILDDFEGEAKEIHEHNPWLVYGEPLNRLREWGITQKEFDLLDEAKLSSEQMRAIIAYLYFGGNPNELPHPEVNWDMFVKAVKPVCDKEPKVWNPITKKLEHMIDFKSLSKAYHDSGGCVIM